MGAWMTPVWWVKSGYLSKLKEICSENISITLSTYQTHSRNKISTCASQKTIWFWMYALLSYVLEYSILITGNIDHKMEYLSFINIVKSAYLRLLIFLPAILIPACASSSPVFLMMYLAYKLNKQGDNIQPWRTPFPIWNQSVVPCPVLTVASWPAYRLLKRQFRWSGIPISFRIFHSLLWSTQSKALA